MIKLNLKSAVKVASIAAFGLLLAFCFSGCKKKEDPPASGGGGGAGGGGVTADYVSWTGVNDPNGASISGAAEIKFEDPTIGTSTKNVQDEYVYTWIRNPDKDRTITMQHLVERKEGSVPKNSWTLSVKLGAGSGASIKTINLQSGDLVLSKDADGKWVSTITSGVGTDAVDVSANTYTGIKAKITWPN